MSQIKPPQTLNPTVKIPRRAPRGSSLSRESSPSNSRHLQPPIPQSKPGQGLYILEQPLVKSIQSSDQYTQSELRSYAISIIKEGQVNYTKKQDGTLSAALSDQVLKRCKDNSANNQGTRKKIEKLRKAIEILVCDQEVKDEAEKKGRKASESNLGEEDPSSLKSSRLKSPPPK